MRETPVPQEGQDGYDEEAPAIAVIGMAGRFPGADDLDAFWDNLAAGRESVRPVTDEEFLAAGGDPADLDDPSLIRMASVVEGIDRFDSGFFGYSPAEAAVVDPQQRLLLETAYQALENAGCLGPGAAEAVGTVGVYAGSGDSRYYPGHVHPRFAGQPGSVALVHAATANSLGTLATRLSYELGLTGPSVSLQTACSTALVAVHTACQELLDYRCDTALAAAVSLNPSARLGYRHVPDGPFSPDGHCRAFAADAAGTSSGDGVGAVVLKRLEDALADGDRVRAVIRGSAVNNDGRRKVGFSAPSSAGQTEVILAAQAQAMVDAGSIGLVEAHGTATKLGDPIEVSALTEAFRQSTDDTGFCALGSVKTNIGHLGAAAGIAGLIKAVLALEHRQIPPNLHFDEANPLIDFAAGPFWVPTALEDWAAGDQPRRAAVSAFGIGGTNAHVVLEEAPPAAPAAPRAPEDGHRLVLPLSARTTGALRGQADALARHLDRHPGLRLDDVAHSLRTQRPALPHRLTVTAASRDEALAALRTAAPATPALTGEPARVAFLLPGGGTQYPGMGAELYRGHAVYRDIVDECARILRPVLDADLRTTLFDDPEPDGTALFAGLVATEYALARTLMEAGVRPDALIGHSLGEYTAACLAGVMDLDAMLPLVTERVRLIASAGGATVGVAAPAEELLPLLDDDLSLAAVNGPAACTVAGHADAVARFEAELARRDLPFRRLRIPAAAHSHVLDPVLGTFESHLRTLTLRPPRIPYVTNVTGTWVTDAQATSVEHWLDHTRRTVRFTDGVTSLWERMAPVLVEIGPGDTMTKLAAAQLAEHTPVTVTTMRHAKADAPDDFVLTEALGRLWSAGVESALPPVPGTPGRVPLPPYAFERHRHWIDAPGARTDPDAADSSAAAAPGTGLAPRPRLTTGHVPPRTDREEAVTRLWEETLGIGGIGVNDNFFDLGGDSMRAVLLAGRLRSAGVLDVPAATLLAAPTVAGVLATAEDTGADSAPPGSAALGPLLPLRPEGSAAPLFCVHPGAGVSWRYTGLLPHLGGEQPVYGIQAAGLDGTRPPAPDAAAMVAHYVGLVREVQPAGPYRLLGWSYGGFVAHAMACALQEQGERVELLAMLDAPQPHGTAHDPDAAERQVAALLTRVAGLPAGQGADPRDVDAVLDRIDAAVTADRATSPVTRAEAAAIAEVMRNNLRLAPQFAPGVYRGDVLFFSAEEETDGAGDLAVMPGKADAWRPHVDGALHDHRVPCGHYEMTEPDPIARIGAAVAKALRPDGTA
ncbi:MULTISPECIES: type I polyketide synthase [Streptomyces]|uniref:Beta-ketoacyl synthase N-terminal-like domain-containing protein n=1 Tax=Streptomyces doudnae TaxID=3075536 RepID=A0ABD5ENN7_9ACTN|nr:MULTISPECIES: type I polyketide synthase [unclassified Streptomyces]MDT0436313.1 beta-ketoacyl synthase N-terminal-like domain-containing protein [Streptomyces sp. DSM 41981]MYQ65268.1 type I polyketide synthase [Streptomyces sp. SID4950]SCD96079.1 Acyl transferase domain-containing protein [Streptomyces sp. SolWspMP-5a-2]